MAIASVSKRNDPADPGSVSEAPEGADLCSASAASPDSDESAAASTQSAASAPGIQSLTEKFPTAQTWKHLPVGAAPFDFQGCGSSRDCADWDGRSVHEGQTSNDPAASLTLTVRRFAPFVTFGGKFEGDAHSRHIADVGQGGFTTDPDATARTTLTVRVDGEVIAPLGRADVSRHPLLGQGRATVSVQDTSVATSSVDGLINAKSAGANPLIPVVAPDIDTDIQLAYEVKPGTLDVNGSVWGDRFPNAELYISDRAGTSVMLGEFQTARGALTGPLFSLPFDATRTSDYELLNVHAEIPLDPDGDFAGTPAVRSER